VKDRHTFWLDIIGFKIGKSRYVWVCSLAMIAFIVVVGGDFPVIGCVNTPAVIIFVIIERIRLKSVLSVDALKVIRPWNFRLFVGIQVKPYLVDMGKRGFFFLQHSPRRTYEAIVVDVHVDWEKTILTPIKSSHILVARSFCKLAIEAV